MAGSESRKPRVLIISNNVLSTQNNNGKTLLSLFKSVPRENISQLYFSSEKPEEGLASSYYRISDSDALNNVLRRKENRISGGTVSPENDSYIKLSQSFSGIPGIKNTKIKRIEFTRIVREVIWKLSSWNSIELREWIKKVNPDIVFFCAGDSLFAHRIYNVVANSAPSARKVVYVTDDYIMPRFELSPFWWLRRHYVYSRMRRTVSNSDVFVTISDEMRAEYLKRFGKDSINIFNTPDNLKIDSFKKSPRGDYIMVYAGGLHFGRWKTLHRLAEALKEFNEKNGRSVLLKVFSHQDVEDRIRLALTVPGGSEFMGALDSNELKYNLNDADFLVHVESFSKKHARSTRLSISTKIFEYLNVGSKVVAIGPSEISSMRFLSSYAFCITSYESLEDDLVYLLSDHDFTLFKYNSFDSEACFSAFKKRVLC